MRPLNKVKPMALLVLLLSIIFSPAPALGDANIQHPSSVGVGNPFVIRVTSDVPLDAVSAAWQGRTIPLEISQWNDKHVVLGLFGTQAGKVKPGSHRLKIFLKSGEIYEEVFLPIEVTSVKYQEDHLTLPEKMVTPPPSVMARIATERKASVKALATSTLGRSWTLPMTRPVGGIVTSSYGRRRILNKKPRAPHMGIDFRAARGTPVKAAFAGRVILAGDFYFAGKNVFVDSGGGIITQYMHLDSINVKEGEQLSQGAIVGKSGMTGRATGPHLHFGLYIAGQYVNAGPLFDSALTAMLDKATLVRISMKGGE